MGRLQRWLDVRVRPMGPAFATLALLTLSIVLAACGKGGGSGY